MAAGKRQQSPAHPRFAVAPSTRHALAGVIAPCALLFAAAALLTGPLGGASAQVAQPVPQEDAKQSTALAPLITDLGADNFAVRERASAALTSQAPALEQALTSGDVSLAALSAEQKLRLDEALRDHFVKSPRPGMGIQFAAIQPGLAALTIQRVVAGFPASRLLRAGDTIVEIDSERLGQNDPQASARVRQHILSYKPGESIALIVSRTGERLELRVPLGRYDKLANQATLPPSDDLHGAWRIRAARLGLALDTSPPIHPQALDGSDEAAAAARALLSPEDVQKSFLAHAGVIAGGSSQTTPEAFTGAMGGAILAQRMDAEHGRISGRPAQKSRAQRDGQARAELFRRLQILRLTEAQHRKLATNPNIPDAARQAARERLNAIRNEIIEVQKAIRDASQ